MTGQAPTKKNTTPPTKLMPAIRPITTKNPTLLSERCGVSSAEKSMGSGLAAAVGALLSLMRPLYRLDGTQDDPQESQEIRQAEGWSTEAMDAGRGRGGVPPLQKGEP